MTTIIRFAAVLSLIILAGTVPSAWGGDANSRVIRLISRATSINNFVDVEPPGPSPGDIYVFVDELFAYDTPSEKVGEVAGRCNLIDPSRGSFECTTVSSFAEGTITTSGILYNVPGVVSVGSVTGGTGDYRGVRGEGRVDLGPPEGPHQVTFILHP